jgi:sarcosine oxidase subunit beta
MTVALLEKNLCGAGASGVNFGGVRQQGRHLAELPLARRARPLWDGLNTLLGEDVEFVASGHVKLARSEVEMAQLEAYARDAAERGLRLQLLGQAELRAGLPWLGRPVFGASLCAEDGIDQRLRGTDSAPATGRPPSRMRRRPSSSRDRVPRSAHR